MMGNGACRQTCSRFGGSLPLYEYRTALLTEKIEGRLRIDARANFSWKNRKNHKNHKNHRWTIAQS